MIEAAPPLASLQGSLLPDSPTPDDVAHDFVEEMARLARKEQSLYSRREVRRRIQSLVKGAADIGSVAEAIHRPLETPHRSGLTGESRARMNTASEILDEVQLDVKEPRRRRVTGRVYMVDVEPGRWKIRVKLPDGRDVTLDANIELATQMKEAVDRVVEIDSVEELVGNAVSGRTALALKVLPSAGSGSFIPPKSLEELASEQGMPTERPDYGALATAVWQTDADLTDFESHLMRVRHAI